MEPEAWLRGPLPDVDPYLMPAAHALVQSGEDLAGAVAGLDAQQLWARPGGAASVGFHLRHIPGALDRLLTYARGEALTDAQRAAAKAEAGTEGDVATLLAGARRGIEQALARIRSTPRASRSDSRGASDHGARADLPRRRAHPAAHRPGHRDGQGRARDRVLTPSAAPSQRGASHHFERLCSASRGRSA